MVLLSGFAHHGPVVRELIGKWQPRKCRIMTTAWVDYGETACVMTFAASTVIVAPTRRTLTQWNSRAPLLDTVACLLM